MKRYTELSTEEQARALQHATNQIVDEIATGVICFVDAANEDDTQARIDAFLESGEEDRGQLYEIAKACIDDLADERARETFYPEPGEHVAYIPRVAPNVLKTCTQAVA